MFGSGYHTIDPSCTEVIKAFEEREYNKNGEPADDGSSDVDSIDGSDYGWLKEMDLIYEVIMSGNYKHDIVDNTMDIIE